MLSMVAGSGFKFMHCHAGTVVKQIDTSLAANNLMIMICPDICFEFSESRPSNTTGTLVCSCFRCCLLGHLPPVCIWNSIDSIA